MPAQHLNNFAEYRFFGERTMCNEFARFVMGHFRNEPVTYHGTVKHGAQWCALFGVFGASNYPRIFDLAHVWRASWHASERASIRKVSLCKQSATSDTTT